MNINNKSHKYKFKIKTIKTNLIKTYLIVNFNQFKKNMLSLLKNILLTFDLLI